MRYSIYHLLVVTALIAVSVSFCRWFDWQVNGILMLLGLLGAGGYVAGWTARASHNGRAALLMPAVAFVVLNWSLWYLNHIALYFAYEAAERGLQLVELGELMVDAEHRRCFDTAAAVFTCLIGFAAWKKNDRLLFGAGAICVVTWLIIVSNGYLMACVGLLVPEWQLSID